MRRTRWIALSAVLTVALASARSQTSYPMITKVEPVALARGAEIEVVVSGGGNFDGATRLLFEGTGLDAKIITVGKSESEVGKVNKRIVRTGTVKARLTASRDAELGPRELRVVTPQGVSSIGIVVVVPSPTTPEADDKANDSPETAQSLKLPAYVTGTIGKTEDVDWYRFEAKAGRRVTFTCWGNRLQNKIHDLRPGSGGMHLNPILQIHDATGRELGSNDNHYYADPLLSIDIPADGVYFIQLRDVNYGGDPGWTYVLNGTDGPYATTIHPLAVNPGKRASLKAAGANLDPAESISLDVPAATNEGLRALLLPSSRGETQPVSLLITKVPVVLEGVDALETTDKASPLVFPSSLCGRLDKPGDIDAYRFDAKKGKVYSFEAWSRRAGAETDPVLKILNDKSASVTEADDTFGKDPRIEWTSPADGVYSVAVNDLHARGGDAFGYVIEAKEAAPDFVAVCDPDKVNLGPGSRSTVFVKVDRRAGFKGPVRLEWSGLPAGVTSSSLTIPPEMKEGVLVLSADKKAAGDSSLARLVATAEAPGGSIVREVRPLQEIYMPGGGRSTYAVETLPIAVTGPSDILVETSSKEVTLEPGKSVEIEVDVIRQAGYDKAVNLAVHLEHLGRVFAASLPPGVTISPSSKTLLGPKDVKGKIVLTAKEDAPPCDRIPFAVMGHVSINFVVKTAYSTGPILLTVPAKAKK